MEDEDKNSKSLLLITRVGSTPTTGIESSSKSKGFGLLFSFGLYNKCWGREKNPAPFSQKKVEHTNQNLYNRSTPTQLKGETYVLRK